MNDIVYEYRVIEEGDVRLMEDEGWRAVARENFWGSNVFHPIVAPKKRGKILVRVKTGPKF